MMKKINYPIAFLLIVLSYSVEAQLSLSGEIRPRTEMYGGANSRLRNEGESVGIATQQRTRFNFTFQDSTGLKIVFSPQLIHFWGQMPQAYDLLGDGAPGAPEPNFSVFEAYAQYKATDWYTLKVGRQAISYGDQRWFGALQWAAAARAHDALVNKLSFGDIKVDVGVALNRTKHFQGVDETGFSGIRAGYDNLQYLWATIPVGDLKIQAMVTNVGFRDGANDDGTSSEYSNVTTYGILPSFSSDDLTINASAYLQSGENLSSNLFAFDITYKGLGLPLTLGMDIVSGDDSNTEDSETWLQPFGTNHKFYGYMDFFYVGETPVYGLNDIYAKAVINAGEKSKIIVMPHLLSTNQAFFNSEGEEVDGSFGTEIDLVYNLNVSKSFNFKFGYSTIFANDLLSEMPKGFDETGTVRLGGSADEFNHWAWMQLTFKPSLFESK